MAVTHQQVFIALAQGHALVVLDPLVSVDHEKRDGEQAFGLLLRDGPGPVDVQQHALRQGMVAGLGHHPAGPQLGMAAAVQDAVGLGDVVQHGAGAHSGHIDREPGRAGPLGQLGGDMGHHARMGADIVQHAIFVPKGHAGGIVGDAALRGGLQGRFGQAGQRVHQRPFAVFRRADDGSGCGEDGHGGSMPPARGEGNVKEVRRCGRRRMDAAPCRDRAA